MAAEDSDPEMTWPEQPWPGQRENIVTPHPDPTELTTMQLRLTETSMRREIEATRAILAARLDAMDEATRLRLAQFGTFPTELDKEVTRLKELIDLRVGAHIQNHVRDIESLTKQHEQDTKDKTERHDRDIEGLRDLMNERNDAAREALRLAVRAPAEAAEKVEKSTDKQLTNLQTTIRSDKENNDKQLAAITSRLDRIEATGFGVDTAKNATRNMVTVLIAFGGLLTAAITIILATR